MIQFELNHSKLLNYNSLAYKAGEPGLVFGRARKGRTTEGTLGRIPSTVANRARRSVGGGVLINIIKLADFS